MRVLHVVPSFHPESSFGGPIHDVYTICRELIRRGHQPEVWSSDLLSPRRRTAERVAIWDGIGVQRFKTYFLGSWGRTVSPAFIVRTARAIDQFDVVHLNGHRNHFSVIAAFQARRRGVPYAVHTHGALVPHGDRVSTKRWFDRLVGHRMLQRAGRLVALTEEERDAYLHRGLPGESIVFVPSGIDVAAVTPLPERGQFREKFGIPGGDFLLLFLARLHKKKGLGILLDALAPLRSQPGWTLAIVGPDEGYEQQARQTVDTHGLQGRVIFSGAIYGHGRYAAYRDADLYVLPSYRDELPVTVIEACVAGTPVVISDRCGITEIVRERIGKVVPCDSAALADAIREMMTDREALRRYAARTQEVVAEYFDIRRAVDRLEHAYQELAARPSGK